MPAYLMTFRMAARMVFLWLLIPADGRSGPTATDALRRTEPRIVVENYIESLYLYCKKYDASHRFHIENQLLADPNIRIGNDISGLEDRDIQANFYFVDLKKQGVKVEYRSDFEIRACTIRGTAYTLCLLHKKLHYRNGLKDKFTEVVDLVDLGNGNWRIRTIVSSLFYNLPDFYCGALGDAAGPDLQGCGVLALAEKEYGRQDFRKALPLYEDALDCTGDSAYVLLKVKELRTLVNLPELLADADQYSRMHDHGMALSIYQSILENGSALLDSAALENVRSQIVAATRWLQRRQLLADAEAYVSARAFTMALPLYREAQALFPDDPDLAAQLADCERQAAWLTETKIRALIKEGNRLIEMGDLAKGFEILLRHRETGLLGTRELFYMAQILDLQPARIKRKFDLSNIDCCILTRQFMIEAKNKGAFSQDFRYLWEAHFNQKSRTCLH